MSQFTRHSTSSTAVEVSLRLTSAQMDADTISENLAKFGFENFPIPKPMARVPRLGRYKVDYSFTTPLSIMVAQKTTPPTNGETFEEKVKNAATLSAKVEPAVSFGSKYRDRNEDVRAAFRRLCRSASPSLEHTHDRHLSVRTSFTESPAREAVRTSRSRASVGDREASKSPNPDLFRKQPLLLEREPIAVGKSAKLHNVGDRSSISLTTTQPRSSSRVAQSAYAFQKKENAESWREDLVKHADEDGDEDTEHVAGSNLGAPDSTASQHEEKETGIAPQAEDYDGLAEQFASGVSLKHGRSEDEDGIKEWSSNKRSATVKVVARVRTAACESENGSLGSYNRGRVKEEDEASKAVVTWKGKARADPDERLLDRLVAGAKKPED